MTPAPFLAIERCARCQLTGARGEPASVDDRPDATSGRAATVLRQQYNLAIDHVVGDHQPAPLITGEGAGRDVPIHVISGSAQLLEPFLAWGLRPGIVPASDQPARRMDPFRDWLIGAFSRASGTTTAHAAP
jgi:hypothetical protein